MRRLIDAGRIDAFMQRLGRAARAPAEVYLVGGATAVLYGWRESTVDIDLKLVPDREELLRALPAIKEELELNVELASPDLFVPVSPGWEDRSPSILRVGQVAFRHFDLTAQALAKVERGHVRDREDVHALLGRGLVTPAGLRRELAAALPELYRFPAVDPAGLQRRVDAALEGRA